jgi:hypothetical protein
MKKTKITPAGYVVTPNKWLHFNWPKNIAQEPIAEFHRDFLKKIEGDVVTIDPTVGRDSDIFRIAVLVIAGGMLVGPFLDRLLELTGFPRAMVSDVCHNMRSVGLWKEFATDAEWIDEEGYKPVALWGHVLVAEGLVTAEWNKEKNAWAYHTLPVI